jgi:hypothetical protein
LLTPEQRKKFITFALDPAKRSDRAAFLNKASEIQRSIHDGLEVAEA